MNYKISKSLILAPLDNLDQLEHVLLLQGPPALLDHPLLGRPVSQVASLDDHPVDLLQSSHQGLLVPCPVLQFLKDALVLHQNVGVLFLEVLHVMSQFGMFRLQQMTLHLAYGLTDACRNGDLLALVVTEVVESLLESVQLFFEVGDGGEVIDVHEID